jgi:hypothetical protein
MAEATSELMELHQADIDDRSRQDPKTAKNDNARISTVRKLDGKGWLCRPADKFHAAWVLKRSEKPADLQRAYTLAQEAMGKHVANANWVVATVFDRWRVYRGQTQRYGSMMANKGGKLCIYEVLEEATDEERAQYGLPPLDEQYKRVLESAGFTEPYTLREVKKRNLLCEPVHYKN